jgi:ketosteroid isomerase-like protein
MANDQSAPGLNEKEKDGPCTLSEEDLSWIRTMEAEHEVQAATGDFNAMAKDIAEDILVMAPNQPDIVGKAQLREWQRQWEEISFDTYSLTLEEIIGCGDIAFVRMSYSMSFTPEGAPGPISDSGRGGHILRKKPDGAWEIIRDFFISDQPMPTG